MLMYEYTFSFFINMRIFCINIHNLWVLVHCYLKLLGPRVINAT